MAKFGSSGQLHHSQCGTTPLGMVKLFLLRQSVLCSTWQCSFSRVFLCNGCVKMPGSDSVTFGPGHKHRHSLKEFDLLILTMLYSSHLRISTYFKATFIVPDHFGRNCFLEDLGSEKQHTCDLCGCHCLPCTPSVIPVSCVFFLCEITWKGAI